MNKSVLVLCVGNSCRSQIGEAYIRKFAPAGTLVASAGSKPKGVHPYTVEIMNEKGIDLSHNTSKHVDDFADAKFDFVLTVCEDDAEACPYFPASVKNIHHGFDDPDKATGTEEEVLDAFRKVRDEIKDFSKDFVIQYLKE